MYYSTIGVVENESSLRSETAISAWLAFLCVKLHLSKNIIPSARHLHGDARDGGHNWETYIGSRRDVSFETFSLCLNEGVDRDYRR